MSAARSTAARAASTRARPSWAGAVSRSGEGGEGGGSPAGASGSAGPGASLIGRSSGEGEVARVGDEAVVLTGEPVERFAGGVLAPSVLRARDLRGLGERGGHRALEGAHP